MAAAILVAVAVLAQAPLLFGLVGAGVTTGEAAVNGDVVLPTLSDAAAVLGGGEWPWWNPYARLGEPFMASGAQPLYPGFWPLLFAGGGALPWVLALHSALACVFMFRWLRALPASRYSAFLGGGLWGIGIFFQLQLLRLPEAAACAWLPLALEGTWRTTRPGRTPPYVAAIALGVAAMFATGAHATPMVGTGLCLALGGRNLLGLHRADRLPTLGHLVLGGVGAVLLAAPFWLDGWQQRDVLECGRTPGGSVPTLLSALAPVSAMPGVERSTSNDSLELALFPGTVVLMLLALAFLRPSPGRARWPWVLIAALGLLAASQGPWSNVLREQLALDGRLPGCSLVLLQLGLLVLACQGLDGFLEAPFRRPGVALGVALVAVLLGGTCLTGLVLRPQALAQWFAGGTGSGDPWHATVADAVSRALLPTAVALVLLGATLLAWRRLGILRLKVTLASVVFAEMVYLAWSTAPQRTVPPEVEIVGSGDARVLATDAASAVRLARGRAPARRVNRTGDAVLRRTRLFLEDAAPGALRVGARVRGGNLDPQRFALALASLAQIDVLLGDRAPGTPAFATPAGPEPRRPIEPTPFARLVFQAKVAADTDAAREELRSRPTPNESVVLEGSLGAFAPRAPAKPATVEVVERRSTRLRVHVDAGQGRGILVVADAFAPGWSATVDGEPVPILPADVAFRAVTVPEGVHDVEMVYAPWAKRVGLPLAGLGGLFVLACFVRLRRRQ